MERISYLPQCVSHPNALAVRLPGMTTGPRGHQGCEWTPLPVLGLGLLDHRSGGMARGTTPSPWPLRCCRWSGSYQLTF